MKNVYERFLNGDSLSDEELELGHTHFTQMASLLSASGPVFHLAFCEANRVALRFRDYIAARKG